MIDAIWAYVLFHPLIPFKAILLSEGNFGEYGQLFVAIKISAYLCAYGYLCTKIFRYLDEVIKKDKKKEMPTYLLLKYFEIAGYLYLLLGIIFGPILMLVSL